MEANTERGVQTAWRLTKDREAAVSLDYYWQPMSTCSHHTKVQLLTIGGVAESIFDYQPSDIWLSDYHCHPAIKAPVAV